MAADEHKSAAPASSEVLAIDTAIRFGLLALLGYWSLTVIAPFLTIILWSGILTVALYPLFDWLAGRLGSRRLAALLVTLPCLLIVIGPIAWLGFSLTGSIKSFFSALDTGQLSLPSPSESVKEWPLVGEYVYKLWHEAVTDVKSVLLDLAPQLKPVGIKILGIVEGVGFGLLEFVVAISVAGFLFSPGPQLIVKLKVFLRRVLSDRGEEMLELAGATIRNISRGVVGVALLQSALGGIGLLMVNIPAAGFLTFLALMFGIIQIGPAIIFVPAVIWCWVTKDTTTALIFTAYMAPVGLVDNVLRPIVMTRGLTTPMPVIVIGVFGGTIAFGLIGLFLGPIALSVAWALSQAWLKEHEGETAEPSNPDRRWNVNSSA